MAPASGANFSSIGAWSRFPSCLRPGVACRPLSRRRRARAGCLTIRTILRRCPMRRVSTGASSPRAPRCETPEAAHGQVRPVFLFSPHACKADSHMNKPAISGAKKRPRPAVLCILDGWGCRPDSDDNAITRAKAENFQRMWAECPHATLATSGRAVGLPAGQMGNSEVGHMNIGAGRVVVQDLPRIDDAIADRSFASRPALLDLIVKAKKA